LCVKRKSSHLQSWWCSAVVLRLHYCARLPVRAPRQERTMTDFTIDEDKSLLLLVPMFEGDDGAIDWQTVVKYLQPTTRAIQDLQQRLHYLTRSDTTLLDGLPAAYIAKSSLARFWLQHGSGERQPSVSDERQQPLADLDDRPATVTNETESDVNRVINEALADVFAHLTKKNVRQPSGQAQLNVGEIAPSGVTQMLEELNLNDTDVFIDVGSGVGNILVQVVLMTQVKRAVGLEIQTELAMKSRQAIEGAKDKYQLDNIEVINGDIKDVHGEAVLSLMDATVVYSNNSLFQPDDNLGLRAFIVNMYASRSHVRAILLTKRMCSRHSPNCKDEFCKLWEERKVLLVPCTWTQKLVEIYVYSFRENKQIGPLTLFNEL
jgi:Histone methylation protein DOT1